MKFKDLPYKALAPIRDGIRMGFRWSTREKFLKSKRIELSVTNKDGSTSKRKRVVYECAECGGQFPTKEIHVDHVEPATPIGTALKEMEIAEFIKNIFFNPLQILCHLCHRGKTGSENSKRFRK